MVELAGLSRIGNDHDGARNGALIAVRGAVPQGKTGSAVVVFLALALSCESRGAAAVKVHGVNTAEILHHKGKIIKIHTGRVRRLTAVDFIEHHGAVGFYADCRAGIGSLGSIGRIDNLAVSHENCAAADGFFHAHFLGHAEVRAGDMRRALGIYPEGGFRAGGRDHLAVHNKSAYGLAVCHVEEGGVHSAHDVYLPAGLNSLGLKRCFLHAPVGAGFDGFNVIVVIAGDDLGIRAERDFHHMAGLLMGQPGVISDELILDDPRRYVVFFARYNDSV